MCFHTSNTKTAKENEKRFDAKFNYSEIYEPYYHLAGYEAKYIYIIRQNNFDVIEPAYWSLMPNNYDISRRKTWISEYKTWNTRSEEIFQGMSSQYVMDQRCIILVDGVYEPHKIKYNNKELSIPYYIKYKDNGLFALAGLYSELDEGLFTASIITREANPFFAKIHNVKKRGTYRMPLVLEEHDEVEWLSDDLNEGDINVLLNTFTKKEFEAYSVSKDIDKNIESNRPDIINPYDYPELNTLFK